MTDDKNQVDPQSDETDIVKDEELVHDAFVEHKITTDEVKDIDEIKELQEEAEKVSIESGVADMSSSVEIPQIEDIDIEIPAKEENDSSSNSSTQENIENSENQEVSQEIKKEINEPSLEIKFPEEIK